MLASLTSSAMLTTRRRRSGLARTGALVFLLPGFVYFVLIFGYPIVETLRMAFSAVNAADFTRSWGFVGLANFKSLPNIPGWDQMLGNTGIFLVATIVPQLVIGGLLAVLLKGSSRVRRVMRSLVLVPWLFPVVATGTVFLLMFQTPGLFDSLFTSLGLVNKPPLFLVVPTDALVIVILANIWIGIPFYYLIIQSGLQSISLDLHEAAALDGASWWNELTRITIPLLRETLITVIMLGILGTMNSFALVWILTQGGPANATMLPGVFAYQLAFENFQYGDASAVVVLIVVVLAVVAGAYLFLTRTRVPCTTNGAVPDEQRSAVVATKVEGNVL